MVKTKCPSFNEKLEFEKWKKLVKSWVRTIPEDATDDEITAVLVMGLSDSKTREGVIDIILDLDERSLYPICEAEDFSEMSPLEGQDKEAVKTEELGSKAKKTSQTTPFDKSKRCNLGERAIPGIELIIDVLEKKFGLNEEERLFKYYEDFETLRKDQKMTMNEYIIKFEAAYRKLQNSGVVLNEVILAYRLLKGASLGKDERLVRTSVAAMTFPEMKKTLLKASDGILCTSESKVTAMPKVKIKEEPVEVLYQRHYDDECYNYEYSPESSLGSFSQLQWENEWHDNDESKDFGEEDCENPIYFNRSFNPYRGLPNRGRSRSQGTMFRGRGFQRGNNRSSFSPPMTKIDQYTGKPISHSPVMNKQDRYTGKTSECRICRSIMHWASECPHRNQNSTPIKKEERTEVILKVDSVMIDDDQLVYLARDSKNLALIDSGASKTVCGKKWFEIYENSLEPHERDKIREERNCSQFKFGDSEPVMSDIVKVIPTKLCGKDVLIKANIVENDVPLLISRHTLSEAKASLNFEHGILEIQGQSQKLIMTPSGHLAVPVARTEFDLEANINVVFLEEEIGTEVDYKKVAMKLHRYFAHAGAERLKKFVNKSGYLKKKEICKEIEKLECEICKKHGREAPKPKTCLPLADRFNQTVALDLKFLDTKEIILHCIDLLTRFSVAVIIKNKTKEEIVTNFFKSWIAVFGRPEQTLSDNGGEFCNQDFVDLCRHLDINMRTTAAFAPFSNGVVERHNGILAEMVYKIREDTGCSTDIALCWAVNAKNNLSNVYGFSPQQLVLGYNSSPPCLDDDRIKITQLDSEASGKMIADHINALFEARKAFIMTQNSDRLKRALKGRIYKAYETKYFPGDKVYYKTNGDSWRGPGIVIGQYQKMVLIKTGGLFVRVHPSRVKLKFEADRELNSDAVYEPSIERSLKQTVNSVHEDSSSDEEEDTEAPILSKSPTQTTVLINRLDEQNVEIDVPTNNIRPAIQEPELKISWEKVTEDSRKKRFVLHGGEEIRFKAKPEDDFKEVTVLCNAGRITSKTSVNKNRYNVESPGKTKSSIFADRMVELERKKVDINNTNLLFSIEDEDGIYYTENPKSEDLQKLIAAKEAEIDNFKKFQVYEEVSLSECDERDQIISSRWITQKKPDGRVKARICARGFEEQETENATDAPTADKTSIRIFLTLVSMLEWETGSLDVKSAFLQSHKLKRKVYLMPPKDIRKEGIIWKVTKPIYGLKDSAKNWYNTLKSDLIKIGCVQSILDPTVFRYYVDNKLKGLFVCHVDDFLYSIGESTFTENVIKQLKKAYFISSENYGSFNYVGVYLNQSPDGIALDQNSFAKSIQPVSLLENTKKNSELLDDKEKTLYQALLGKINWLTHQSRPDLAFYAYTFSLFSKNPTFENMKSLNRFVTKIMNGPKRLKLSKLDKDDLQIVCFSDASLANVLPDKVHSGKGFLTFLCDRTGKCALLNWKSKKIQRIVHSTIASEGLSLVDAIGDACYVRNLIEEILYQNPRKKEIPIEMYVDSKQLFKAASSTHMVTEKLLRINIAEIKQMLSDKSENINLYWIPTKLMLSDCLTKIGASSEKLIQVMETGCIDLEELYEERTCLKE